MPEREKKGWEAENGDFTGKDSVIEGGEAWSGPKDHRSLRGDDGNSDVGAKTCRVRRAERVDGPACQAIDCIDSVEM